MSDYLTIIYRITHPGQPKALLEQAEWSAASYSHAIRERDRLEGQRDTLLEHQGLLELDSIVLAEQRDALLEFAEEVRRSGDARLASMAIAVIAKAAGAIA